MWAKEQDEAPEPPVTCSLSQGIAKCSFAKANGVSYLWVTLAMLQNPPDCENSLSVLLSICSITFQRGMF